MQEVELGGDGRRSGWWRLGVAAAIVGVGLVAVLGGGSDGDGERAASSSTTRSTLRRTTTSSTTTTLPPPSGPVLPVQTGVSVLMAGQSGSWLLLDLDTGGYRTVEQRGSDVYAGFVPVSGGIVVTTGLTATYRPLLSGGAPVDLGEGGVLLSSGRGDRVWIGTSSADGPPEELRLVDLQGRTLAQRAWSRSGFFGATTEGPILGDGGRTFVVGADGPRSVGIGQPVGWSADAVVIRQCDAAGTCVPVVIDLRSGARRELSALRSSIGEPDYGTVELTPDGDLVAFEYGDNGRPHLRWLDGGGRLLAEGDIELDDPNGFGFGFGSPATFLPSRQGLVLPTGRSELTWVRPVDGRLVLERRDLPGSHRVERVALISP